MAEGLVNGAEALRAESARYRSEALGLQRPPQDADSSHSLLEWADRPRGRRVLTQQLTEVKASSNEAISPLARSIQHALTLSDSKAQPAWTGCAIEDDQARNYLDTIFSEAYGVHQSTPDSRCHSSTEHQHHNDGVDEQQHEEHHAVANGSADPETVQSIDALTTAPRCDAYDVEGRNAKHNIDGSEPNGSHDALAFNARLLSTSAAMPSVPEHNDEVQLASLNRSADGDAHPHLPSLRKQDQQSVDDDQPASCDVINARAESDRRFAEEDPQYQQRKMSDDESLYHERKQPGQKSAVAVQANDVTSVHDGQTTKGSVHVDCDMQTDQQSLTHETSNCGNQKSTPPDAEPSSSSHDHRRGIEHTRSTEAVKAAHEQTNDVALPSKRAQHERNEGECVAPTTRANDNVGPEPEAAAMGCDNLGHDGLDSHAEDGALHVQPYQLSTRSPLAEQDHLRYEQQWAQAGQRLRSFMKAYANLCDEVESAASQQRALVTSASSATHQAPADVALEPLGGQSDFSDVKAQLEKTNEQIRKNVSVPFVPSLRREHVEGAFEKGSMAESMNDHWDKLLRDVTVRAQRGIEHAFKRAAKRSNSVSKGSASDSCYKNERVSNDRSRDRGGAQRRKVQSRQSRQATPDAKNAQSSESHSHVSPEKPRRRSPQQTRDSYPLTGPHKAAERNLKTSHLNHTSSSTAQEATIRYDSNQKPSQTKGPPRLCSERQEAQRDRHDRNQPVSKQSAGSDFQPLMRKVGADLQGGGKSSSSSRNNATIASQTDDALPAIEHTADQTVLRQGGTVETATARKRNVCAAGMGAQEDASTAQATSECDVHVSQDQSGHEHRVGSIASRSEGEALASGCVDASFTGGDTSYERDTRGASGAQRQMHETAPTFDSATHACGQPSFEAKKGITPAQGSRWEQGTMFEAVFDMSVTSGSQHQSQPPSSLSDYYAIGAQQMMEKHGVAPPREADVHQEGIDNYDGRTNNNHCRQANTENGDGELGSSPKEKEKEHRVDADGNDTSQPYHTRDCTLEQSPLDDEQMSPALEIARAAVQRAVSSRSREEDRTHDRKTENFGEETQHGVISSDDRSAFQLPVPSTSEAQENSLREGKQQADDTANEETCNDFKSE